MIFGEWLYQRHSIHYTNAAGNAPASLFMPFNVYDTVLRLWMSWDNVKRMAGAIQRPTVPVVAEGMTFQTTWEIEKWISTNGERVIKAGHEGVVVRSVFPFHYGQFQTFVGKYVRSNHVQTDDHWSQHRCVKNEIMKVKGE